MNQPRYTHFVERCRDHDTVLAQCRCPDRDKTVRSLPCPGPPACLGDLVTLSKEEEQ